MSLFAAFALLLSGLPAASAYDAADTTPPEIVSVALDRDAYKPGDTARMTVTVRDENPTTYHRYSQHDYVANASRWLVIDNDRPPQLEQDVLTDNGDGTVSFTLVFGIDNNATYRTYTGGSITVFDENSLYKQSSVPPLVVDDPEHPIANSATITGAPRVWNTLEAEFDADPAATVDYRWAGKRHYIPYIPGKTFTLTGENLGMPVTLWATATWPDGTVRTRGTYIAEVGSSILNFAPVTLSAGPRVGSAVEALHDPMPAGEIVVPPWHFKNHVYQWFRNDQPIEGATVKTYTPTSADYGKELTVRVISQGRYSEPLEQHSTGSVVERGVSTPPTPTLAGTAKVGTGLTASTGAWPDGTALTYQWYRDGVAISGATGKTYALSATDLGKAIVFKARGTNPYYAPLPVVSSTPIGPVTEGMLSASTLTIAGTKKVGYTLAAAAGTWTSGTAFTYRWYRSGTLISGATSKSYRLAGADAGKAITVHVTGTKAGYAKRTKASAATTAVAKGTLSASTPTITGTKKVGYKLKATAGTWTSGTSFTYQWYRSRTAIKGATGKYRTLTRDDAGKTMTVKVTGTKTGYTNKSKISAATRRIAK